MVNLIISINHEANTTNEYLFFHCIKKVQWCGTDYRTPAWYEIGGELMDVTFECFYKELLSLLIQNMDDYSITIHGDGAIIQASVKINVWHDLQEILLVLLIH